MNLFEKEERALFRHKNIVLTRKYRGERRRRREKHHCCNDHGKYIVGNSLSTRNLCPNTRGALMQRLWNKRYIGLSMKNVCTECV